MFSFLRSNISARLARRLGITGVSAAMLAMAACSSDPVTAPVADVAPASSTLIGTLTGTLTGTVDATTSTVSNVLTSVTALRWSTPASEAIVIKTIGSAGGTITAPGGLTLTVPKGAVSSNTVFSVRRIPGNVVAYDFEPHGKTFAQPLVITQATAGTNFRTHPLSALVRGAYFPRNDLIDQLLGKVLVSEFRSATVASDRSTVRFTVDHFSGYMVSMD